ncbi:hypothetical protein JTB14_035379 [Gonioctena quinquepunctata]|nr:hypothetical protein JTB14_035379 [Gonioctena quinquepunctata]
MEDIMLKSNVSHNQTISIKHSNERPAQKDKEGKNESNGINATKNSKPIEDKKAGTQYQELQNKQTSLMSQLISINSDVIETLTGGTNALQTNNEDEFKTVRHKKKRSFQIGQAQRGEEDRKKLFCWRSTSGEENMAVDLQSKGSRYRGNYSQIPKT